MTETRLVDKTISEIRLLSDVARSNEDYLSLKDAAILTSIEFEEAELSAKWNFIPELSDNYKLEQDLIVDQETSASSEPAHAIVAARRARAEAYLIFARTFAALIRDPSSKLISISGSTSYFSAKSTDDLDFFVVSEKNSLWVFLFKSLILARIFRLLHPGTPRICFSCAIDESFAGKIFADGDPLLARDALNVIPLRGESYYQDLVRKSEWISKYFPRLYRLKTEHHDRRTVGTRRTRPSSLRRGINLLLFFFLGYYIRTKSNLLNRKFLREGGTQSQFIVRTGLDHCIFDSLRYSRLRQIYNRNSQNDSEKIGAPETAR